jgi:hypothetical protein
MTEETRMSSIRHFFRRPAAAHVARGALMALIAGAALAGNPAKADEGEMAVVRVVEGAKFDEFFDSYNRERVFLFDLDMVCTSYYRYEARALDCVRRDQLSPEGRRFFDRMGEGVEGFSVNSRVSGNVVRQDLTATPNGLMRRVFDYDLGRACIEFDGLQSGAVSCAAIADLSPKGQRTAASVKRQLSPGFPGR